MEVLAIARINPSRSTLWILIIFAELLLVYTTVLLPYYSLPLFLVSLLVLAIFFHPELAYFLFILSISCHLLQFQISFAHSVPPRIPRLGQVPVDIVALRSLITNILVIIAALSWMFAKMAKARPPYPKTALDMPLAAFLIWSFMSLLWAPDWSTGFIVIIALSCCYLGFFLSVTVIRTKKILNKTIWLFIFLGLANAMITAYSLHGKPVIEEIYRNENISIIFNFIHMARERGMGLTYSPMTAYFLNIPIMLSIAMFLVTKNAKKRFIIALILLFMVYAHIATISKGGLLGLLAGVSFIIITYKPLRRHLVMSFSLIVFILIISAILVYISWPWPEKAEFLRGRQSLSPRLIIWANGFEDLLKSHGFGYGVGCFYPAHSIPFHVLFELGIPGLAIWLWLLLRLFCAVGSSLTKKVIDPYYYKMVIGFSAGMISILTVGLFDSYYFEEAMWTFLGVGMAILNLSNKSTPGNQPINAIA